MKQNLEFLDNLLDELYRPVKTLADMNQLTMQALKDENYLQAGYYVGCMDRMSLQVLLFVKNLQRLSQVQKNGILLEEEKFDAHELVQACKDYFQDLNMEKQLSFLWSGDLDGVYLGDERQFRRIILLLIENAMCNSAPDGSLRAEVSRQAGDGERDILSFELHNSGGLVAFPYQETEVGIEDEDLLQKALRIGPEICLAQCAAQAMGGSLRIYGEPDAGTVARLQVALKRVSE